MNVISKLVILFNLIPIPFLIGKNSNGEDKLIDLFSTSLLMISYSQDEQLIKILKKLFDLNNESFLSKYLITTSRILEEIEINNETDKIFLRDAPEKSLAKFLNEINKQIAKRYKEIDKEKRDEFKRIVLIIDDIWSLVISKPRSNVLLFINILLKGSAVGVNTIIFSGISYRNLLPQLIEINPEIKAELQKKYGILEPKTLNIIGTELIFTPDDLVFLRKKGEMEVERYFK